MSLGRRCLWGALALYGAAFGARSAHAQDIDKPPFYEADVEKAGEESETAVFGTLTASTFYFRENGSVGIGVDRTDLNGPRPESASSVDRAFMDLRLQLDAKHLGGGSWDFRADVRGRYQPSVCKERVFNGMIYECPSAQSGTFGGQELDGREFYLHRRGKEYDLRFGRQYALEMAGIKFDGVRIEQHKGDKWKYFGFGGLYPLRGSRDVREDYPVAPPNPMDPNGQPARLMPVVGGLGGSYRGERSYGSIGVGGILPLADDFATNAPEKNRFFVSSNGYWQQSDKTDIYHYVVIDVAGANGAGISNFTVGVNHRPTANVTAFAQIDRVDTETLNVHAQLRLEEQDNNAAGAALIQNNVLVSRVAQEAVRGGLTSAFSASRFQLSASGTLRRRPEIRLVQNDGTPVALPLAQSLDLTLRLVDRRSYKKFRLGASVTRSQGVGSENLDRSESLVARVDASRDLPMGRGEYEVNLSYVSSKDQDLTQTCDVAQTDILQCYGTAQASTIGVGGLVFYRPKAKWFLIGSASIATQALTTADIDGQGTAQPSVLMLTGFVRAAYRF